MGEAFFAYGFVLLCGGMKCVGEALAGEEIKGEIDFETSGGTVVVAMSGKDVRIVFGHGLEGGVFDDDALDGATLEDGDTLLESLLKEFMKHCKKECDGVSIQALVK